MFVYFQNKHQAIWVLLLMTTGTWINYLIKQTVERQRPFSHLAIDSGWSFLVVTLMRVPYSF